MKVDKADKAFSLFVRERAGWKCERCGVQYFPPTTGLQCSHFFGRGNESTRFDPENASAHCMKCHFYFTANPHEHSNWVKKKLGPERYAALVVRWRTFHKKDREKSYRDVKALYDDLKRYVRD